MNMATEDVREIGVCLESGRNRFGPEVKTAPGGVGSPVEERHRCHGNMFRHGK